MRKIRIVTGVAVLALASGAAFAKLPVPEMTPEAQAKAAEAKAKADWSNKVAAYQQCMSENAVAEKYARDMKAAGKTANINITPCNNPGPFVAAGAPAPAQAAAAAPAAAPAKK